MSKLPTKDELKKTLTPEQYSCTQEEGTEKPFANPYWDNHEDGIYVDVVSKEALFSSLDKFDSGTGWPSFSKPLEKDSITTKDDFKFSMKRTEVRSKNANSHLGHLFLDGPGPEKTRYCINSASLKFIPLDQMKKEGYGSFLFAFASKNNWEVATLAGGCFWGMEKLLEDLPGVLETRVGYTGGTTLFAKYEDVHKGTSGHAETVQILFDPKKTSYKDLLLVYFRIHDPTTVNQQGNDRGTQYRSAIFYASDAQKEQALAIKKQIQASGKWGKGKEIVTEIIPLGEFWTAEDFHQKYLDRHQGGYTCHFDRKFDFNSP